MRIETAKLRDFIANLDGREVFASTIYVDLLRQELNGTGPMNASSWAIYFQVSAVVNIEQGTDEIAQALVVCGEYCGVHSVTKNGTTEGLLRSDKLLSELAAYCELRKLVIRPGRLEI